MKLRQHKIKRYGWKPDLPDSRDKYLAPPPANVVLPPMVDLRSGFPPCYNQGELGSCTANAIAGAMEFAQRKEQSHRYRDAFTASRLFIYYNERAIEGTIDEDSGAMIRDGVKSVVKLGAPPEYLWPYSIRKYRNKPNAAAYKEGLNNQAILYSRLCQNLLQLKTCLAQGFPFIFGFSVYENFESAEVARTGTGAMPQGSLLGGHAVLCVGYDEPRQIFRIRNSWGTDWGKEGYFTLPYAYLLDRDLADDFWRITSVE